MTIKTFIDFNRQKTNYVSLETTHYEINYCKHEKKKTTQLATYMPNSMS